MAHKEAGVPGPWPWRLEADGSSSAGALGGSGSSSGSRASGDPWGREPQPAFPGWPDPPLPSPIRGG